MKQVLTTNLKISQNLVMTPQLQQSIKVLQLSRIELIDTIKEEMEINPVIEEEKYTNEESFDEIAEFENSSSDNMNYTEAVEDMDWKSYFENLAYASYNKYPANYLDETPDFEKFTSKKQTLEEYLMWQFKMANNNEEELKIAEHVIYNLNKDGFLIVSEEDIAKELNIDVEKVKDVIKKINFLDPVGIAAKNFQEAVLIQMEFYNCDNEIAKDILKNNIKLLENKNIKTLAKIYNITEKEVFEIIDIIHSFEPRPARNFSSEVAQTIIPDVYVYKKGDDYTIVLNDDGIPKFRINEEYVQMLAKEKKENIKQFLQEKVNNAKWLLRSIEQRERTIYKVVESLLKFQRDFFDKGPSYLKPLILKDVAEDLNLHESTVSRTTNNKYISTPHGIFELKYFFSTGISSSDGSDDFSTRVVMEKIRNIVENEPSHKPYSDEKISEILEKEHNIKIARRTIAKYRSQMNILPSSKRKRFK